MPRRLFIFCLFWLVSPPAWAEGAIHLILSEAGIAYQEAADAFRAGLGASRAVRVWALADLNEAQIRNLTRGMNLVVPVGVKAARSVTEQHAGHAAVLAMMIPRSVGERLQWPASLGRKKTSFVYIDQPASRPLALIQEAFPLARRIGMVVSPENAGVARMLAQEAGRRQLSMNMETVDAAEEVAAALRRVLPESDVLLLVPDALAINAANVRNVLLTTYRYRVPVVGFSEGLSKAGAVASAYSAPGQIGRQAAHMAQRWLEQGELPAPQPAAEFALAFNRHVARSLGINLPDEDEVRRKLRASE